MRLSLSPVLVIMKGDPVMILQHAQAVATMSEPFDPYRKWLGIPPKDQPPNHYRLLGIAHFEDDPDVIENAATRQMAHVRTFQSGKHSALSQKILKELTMAKLCLLQAEKKAPYDDQLRIKLAAEGKLSSDNLLVTSEVIEEPPAYEEPYAYGETPHEEVPGVRRLPSARWKTDAEDAHSAEPPIVPIPMPLETVVAAPPRLSPSIPLTPAPLMVSGSSRSSYRYKKSSSTSIPLAIAFIGLFVLFGGGIAAVALSGAFSKSAEKHPKKAAVTPTKFPIGTAVKEKDKKEPVNVSILPPKPVPPKTSTDSGSSTTEKPNPLPPRPKKADKGAIEDDLRQAVFLGRQALETRDIDSCKTQVVTAENLLDAHANIGNGHEEQVQFLRELLNLNGEFWSLVRDAAINGKVPTGEKFSYRKEEYELVSHEGDLVTYKIGDNQHTSPLMEIHAKAALALAFQSTREDRNKRLAMIAFGIVDKQARDEKFDREWAKTLYTTLALAGHTNALLARELGVEEKPDPAKTKVPEGDDEVPAKNKPAGDKPESR